MKKINILKINSLFGLLLILSLNINAQETLKIEKVIKTDSIGKGLLYATINEWFASSYNSADDVIQMSDKEAGILIGKGSMSYSKKGMSYMCYSGYIKYTIKVYVKHNRYKVVLTDFNHSVRAGNGPQCALGIITTADVYTTKGMSKKYHNNTWNDIKSTVEQFSNRIFESLEKKTKNVNIEAVGDDW